MIWIFLLFVGFSAQADNKPVIESIIGSDAILNGARKFVIGSVLEPGDKLITDDKTVIRVLYPDGSVVVVGHLSEYEVQEKDSENTQWNSLHSGEIHAEVTTQARKQRPHFVIKTRSSIMGVRGTEFDISVDSKNDVTTLHTLQGSVDIANNSKDLISGHGVAVAHDRFVSAVSGKIGSPQHFDQKMYRSEQQKRHPEIRQMQNQPLKNSPNTRTEKNVPRNSFSHSGRTSSSSRHLSSSDSASKDDRKSSTNRMGGGVGGGPGSGAVKSNGGPGGFGLNNGGPGGFGSMGGGPGINQVGGENNRKRRLSR